ncbi:hypothetical protein BGZ65_010545 [Modicella reniformis]|uniref:Uncharacterized protein n=1 Tax=Modicella reniformis TaxID=1440133 RepID=A0A9P6JG04_9FUNG|nr:hypothetical protein BGZ65_010545 [Modicella reniformis]
MNRSEGKKWNSTDMGLYGRYCPQVVKDLSKAPKVDKDQLSKMTVCPPRLKNKDDQLKSKKNKNRRHNN